MNFCSKKSFRGLSWQCDPITLKEPPLGVPKEVVEILNRRDVFNYKDFFKPTFKAFMPDPYVLKGMEEAVSFVTNQVKKEQKICIYGDYDVDGATSTSLMLRYLRKCGYDDSNLMFYIPDRLTEGYGPNITAIDSIKKLGFETIIFVDSGTTAFEPLKYAEDNGINVVVLDHHQAESTLPSKIVVNPKRLDDNSGLDYLCAAGLVFLFLVGLHRKLREEQFFENREEPKLNDLLGLVALGTVADVVPLVGLNRAYVKLGLEGMGKIPGIQSLVKYTEYKESKFTPYSCGFVFGPCINAGGRIDDTKLGTRLLSSDDKKEVEEIAEYLVGLNKERRELQLKMLDEASELALEKGEKNVIVLYNEEWHPGIVGLAAARIKDNFDKTAIVIGADGKGSARAVDGFDVGGAIIEARNQGLLKSGGGHAAAGGLSISLDKLVEFEEFMHQKCQNFERPPLKVDLSVQCGQLSTKIISSFEMISPFGAGNPEPRIAILGGVLKKTRVLKGKHIKAELESNSGTQEIMLFNVIDTPLGDTLIFSEGHYVDVFGKAKLNEYAGRITVQIFPEDIMIGEPVHTES